MKKPESQLTSITKNKKAFHDYHIIEGYEAGLVLFGDEVKSIKGKHINLKGGFVDIENGEAWLNECHVSPYKQSNRKTQDPTRKRKLLLNHTQIENIAKAINEKGVTAIPIEVYLKKGLIKVNIGICRGKKLYDKRETLKKRSQEIEINRQLKRY